MVSSALLRRVACSYVDSQSGDGQPVKSDPAEVWFCYSVAEPLASLTASALPSTCEAGTVPTCREGFQVQRPQVIWPRSAKE